MLSIVATFAFDVVHLTTRFASGLPAASRNVACIAAGFHASTVSGAAARETLATGTTVVSCFTVMLAVALFPSLAAVIVAVPAAIPVTTPFPSTDAMLELDDVQVIVRPASALPLASRGVALSVVVLPMVTSPDDGERSIELTLAADGGVVVPGPEGESELQAASVRAKAVASAEMSERCIVSMSPSGR